MFRARPASTDQTSTEAPSGSHNLLVVSDLHLGDSLRPSDPGYLQRVSQLNRAFSRFLRHYAHHRVDGKPWRLVIAGDMIDFLHAGLYGESGPGQDTPHREAISYCSEAAAIEWLEEVMERERLVFRLLAAFVGAGHQLVIIKGNHDAQFHFEGVQVRFIEGLLALHQLRAPVRRRRHAPEGTREAEKRSFRERISFCRWFYYEEDLVYIEHGNQYDPFCSFEHVLSPMDPEAAELEDPISHRTYRAFAGILGDLDVHTIDQWRLFDYVRWVFGLGPRMIGRLAYTYFGSVSWLMRTKRRLSAAARKAREEHLRLRGLLVRTFGLPEEVLRALDELRERPAGKSVLAGINMLYMDRVALLALNVLCMATAAVAPGSLWGRAAIVGGIAVASLIANVMIGRVRDVSPHPRLLRMAKKVAGLLKVPFVVFGHSHIPVMARASDAEQPVEGRDTWYFNTGSWTSASERGLTHVCILPRREGPMAELRRWCLRSNKPLKLWAPTPG